MTRARVFEKNALEIILLDVFVRGLVDVVSFLFLKNIYSGVGLVMLKKFTIFVLTKGAVLC